MLLRLQAPFRTFFWWLFVECRLVAILSTTILLKQDVLSGKLPCTEEVAATLASFSLQSEFGDCENDEHDLTYVILLTSILLGQCHDHHQTIRINVHLLQQHFHPQMTLMLA
ncbi:hypothetical protein DERF_005018 [Dermatophagoides farinae]|uniref:FERM domain-containing protein n=1 Tax=Dermatophagoides farinae TaxID=6954 RepID=A0A922I3I0_DERFA|nr:hypothetical protein DERF_005018 [Dermatophagoides farinae]